MRARRHPSDVTDEPWALTEPFIPVYPGGRPRKADFREVLDAILDMPRTGRQWRDLPGGFPPESRVWRYFDEWRSSATLDRIRDARRRKVRTKEKPYRPRPLLSEALLKRAMIQRMLHRLGPPGRGSNIATGSDGWGRSRCGS